MALLKGIVKKHDQNYLTQSNITHFGKEYTGLKI